MRRLPALRSGSRTWHLPLTPNVEQWLPLILLQPGGSRVRVMSELIATDISLALWVICRAYERSRTTLRAVPEVAEWLDLHALTELRWTAEAEVSDESEPPFTAQEVQRGSLRALRVARRIGNLRCALSAESGAPADAVPSASGVTGSVPAEWVSSRAYLLALLLDAEDWLAACRSDLDAQAPPDSPDCSDADFRSGEQASCLPPEWRAALGQVARQPAAQSDAADSPGGGVSFGGSSGGPLPTVALDDRWCDALEMVRRAVSAESAAADGSPPGSALQPFSSEDSRPSSAPVNGVGPAGLEGPAAMRGQVDLPTTLTRLAHLLRLEREFDATLERHKLAAMKELAYGASHEINNPLANISTRAQTLLRDEQDPERRRKLATINAQAFRAHEMISDLMLFAHPPEPERAKIDLAEVVRGVVGELAEDAARQQTVLEYSGVEVPVTLMADETLIAAAVRAVCRNALEALASGGRVEVSLEATWGEGRRSGNGRGENGREEPPAGGLVRVRDNGPGLTEEVRRHALEPFYSGREAGRGLGLGLSKCWRIVELHRGRMDIESQPEHGTTVRLWLPEFGTTDEVPETEVGETEVGETERNSGWKA